MGMRHSVLLKHMYTERGEQYEKFASKSRKVR